VDICARMIDGRWVVGIFERGSTSLEGY